jgi:hypothetical protein
MRATRVITWPGAIAGNSASGPTATCGVNTQWKSLDLLQAGGRDLVGR